MSDTKWIQFDQDNNIFTAIMDMGTSVLIRVAVYDMDKDEYLTQTTISVSRSALPVEMSTLLRKSKEK